MTALRPCGRATVEVWLDGMPWRRLPAEVVVRVGLLVGATIDRPCARAIARARRAHAALDVAARALRARDHSSASLRRRLLERGIGDQVSEATVEMLERVGVLDDRRAAGSRAQHLADCGYGDAAIRADLEARRFAADAIAAAIAALEEETVRAARLVERDGATPRTARALARRGFAEDTIEAIVALLG